MPSQFDQAIQAIITGDEATLRALLAAEPALVRQRSTSPHRATLLHYVGANGVETELQKSPRNAAAIVRILLESGAEVDATAPIYSQTPYDTTLGLTVTSIHPCLAGVQVEIVDTLLDFGARVNGIDDDGSPLGCALLFGYTGAAERLAARGARIDNLVYAAGLGRADTVRAMLQSGEGLDTIPRRTDDLAGRFSYPVTRGTDGREEALIVAAMHDRVEVIGLLIDAGVDVNAAPSRKQTALHFAAGLGNRQACRELLRRGADASIVDDQCGQTPAQWAENGVDPSLAAELRTGCTGGPQIASI